MTTRQYEDAKRRRQEAAAEMAQHERENRQRLRRKIRDALDEFREGVAGVDLLVTAIEEAAAITPHRRMNSIIDAAGRVQVTVKTQQDKDPFGDGG